jgi:hypothetical protein
MRPDATDWMRRDRAESQRPIPEKCQQMRETGQLVGSELGVELAGDLVLR